VGQYGRTIRAGTGCRSSTRRLQGRALHLPTSSAAVHALPVHGSSERQLRKDKVSIGLSCRRGELCHPSGGTTCRPGPYRDPARPALSRFSLSFSSRSASSCARRDPERSGGLRGSCGCPMQSRVQSDAQPDDPLGARTARQHRFPISSAVRSRMTRGAPRSTWWRSGTGAARDGFDPEMQADRALDPARSVDGPSPRELPGRRSTDDSKDLRQVEWPETPDRRDPDRIGIAESMHRGAAADRSLRGRNLHAVHGVHISRMLPSSCRPMDLLSMIATGAMITDVVIRKDGSLDDTDAGSTRRASVTTPSSSTRRSVVLRATATADDKRCRAARAADDIAQRMRRRATSSRRSTSDDRGAAGDEGRKIVDLEVTHKNRAPRARRGSDDRGERPTPASSSSAATHRSPDRPRAQALDRIVELAGTHAHAARGAECRRLSTSSTTAGKDPTRFADLSLTVVNCSARRVRPPALERARRRHFGSRR